MQLCCRSIKYFRLLHSSSIPVPVKLPHRQLVEVKGSDGCGFLQGLITADVVSPTRVVQYGMFLSTQGRILYDVLFYHMGNERVWLECCSDVIDDIIKHMKKYQLRSKVTISHVTNVDVYSIVTTATTDKLITTSDQLLRAPDPRSSLLGDRLLVSSASSVGNNVGGVNEYHKCRVSNRVPEGSRELPPSQCLPFEVNIDLMNGVSFTKGCYIGQELTSRTYHTGVLRKRLLSLRLNKFEATSPPIIPWGAKVMSHGNKIIGKVIAHHEDLVLTIIRLPDVKQNESIKIVTDNGLIDAVVISNPYNTQQQ